MTFKWSVFSFFVVCLVRINYVLCADQTKVDALTDKQTEELNKVTKEVISKGIITLSNQFNYLLSRSKGKDENIVFAPVNIVKTLAIVMLGTAGETEIEIARALGWAAGTDLVNRLDLVHEVLGLLLGEITKHPGTEVGVNLNIAGAVFVQNGHNIRKKYLELARSIYSTQVMNLDFSANNVEATKTVNEWVSNNTLGRIKELLPQPVSSSTLVLIAGILYFNGNWEYPFQPRMTRWQAFFLGSEGKTSKQSVQVQMMVNTATIPYYEDSLLGYQAIGIPYKGKDMFMYILLPNINFDLKKFATLLSYTDIKNTLTKSKEVELMYIIPKMKLSSTSNLNEPLKKLSVHSLFDPAKANFTNLADGIFADDILHQVELEIDEVGTIGAAATAVIVTRGGMVMFRADRPFLFFIHNTKVDIITFWGSIFKPTPYK